MLALVGSPFRSLLQSEYGRAIATLSGGRLVSVAIPVLAAPILGRLYTPEDYGIFALYIAFAAVFAGASTLQYQNGVLAVAGERQSQALAGLAIIASFAIAPIAAITAVAVWFLLENDPAYGADIGWIFLLPVSTVFASVWLTCETMMNRLRNYGALVRLQAMVAGIAAIGTIILGVLGWGVSGVMLGVLVGDLFRLAGCIYLFRKGNVRLFSVSSRGAIRLAKRHKSFPIFTMPAMLLSSTVLQLPAFVLGWLGATATLGSYNRAQRLVAMPFLLVGTSIAQVFHRRGSEMWRQTGSCRPLYLKTAALLAVIGFPPMAIILMYGPELFGIILGENWVVAGEVARILAPMLFLRTLASPLESVFQFTDNQKTAFWLNIVLFALIALGTIGSFVVLLDPMAVVIGFSVASSAGYLISFGCSYLCSRNATPPKA